MASAAYEALSRGLPVRFDVNEGVSQATIDDFLAQAEKQGGVAAGKYFGENGKYRAVTGNANEADWGAYVPPGYRKIGSGENTLIVQRLDDAPQSQQAATPESKPREPLPTSGSLASAREAYNRANFYAQSPSGEPGFNATLSGPDLYQSIAKAGAEKTNHYTRRFLPQLGAASKLNAEEIGFATQQAINSLPDDIKVPKYEDIFAKGGLYERLRADIA